MVNSRLILMAAATVAAAAGIGIFMQPQLPGGQAASGAEAAALPQLPKEPAATQLTLEKITLTAAPRRLRQAGAGALQDETRAEPAPACGVTATAAPLPGAMVRLSAASPCRAGGRVTVHHQGMMFTATLDGAGDMAVDVPALAEHAVFIVEPEAGQGAAASARVEGLEGLDRVVLQWSGSAGFELHALEYGAAYGSPGHVWHGAAPGDGSGTLVRLGDGSRLAPRIAEIYTLPRIGRSSGTVELSAEAEITALNCGLDATAQSLFYRDGRLRSRDLVLQMPDCSETGGFLVLNNLLENLKIAANRSG
ncbi:hypothetical protein ACUXV3_13950 [Roseobacteraceae bacterium NS-SX3]